MNNTIKKKHITALLAAMALVGSPSAMAAAFGDNLQDNNQVGTTYVSAVDGDVIRFGANNTVGGGGAVANNTTIATLTTSDPLINKVYTPLNNISPTLSTNVNGGLVVDPTTGNTTVAQGATTVDSLLSGLVRVREQEVYSNDPANAPAIQGTATPTPAATLYGTLNGGVFVPLPGALTPATIAAIEAFASNPTAVNAQALMTQVASVPADATLLSYSTGTSNPVAGTGNLIVQGSTSTNGLANTGALSTDSLTVGGVAAATVNDVSAEAAARAAADVTLQNNITSEAGTRAAQDIALQNNINSEAATRAAQDVALQNNINAEAATRAAQDGVLQNNINAEAATRAAQDVVLQNNINAEAATRASEDVLIRADIAAEAATRLAADTTLQANINAEVAARIADVNAEEQRAIAAEAVLSGRATVLEGRATALEGRTTALEGRVGQAERDIRSLRKGVAMAAALQTPVINSGDKMAVKVGASVYDGEQGLGLGFAGRVNDSVTINVDVATGFPETVARGGVNFSF